MGMNEVNGKTGANEGMSYTNMTSNVDDANLWWNFGRTVESNVAFQGNTGLFCSTAIQWMHDQSRTVEVVITYDK
jgi:hypothetical protein